MHPNTLLRKKIFFKMRRFGEDIEYNSKRTSHLKGDLFNFFFFFLPTDIRSREKLFCGWHGDGWGVLLGAEDDKYQLLSDDGGTLELLTRILIWLLSLTGSRCSETRGEGNMTRPTAFIQQPFCCSQKQLLSACLVSGVLWHLFDSLLQVWQWNGFLKSNMTRPQEGPLTF